MPVFDVDLVVNVAGIGDLMPRTQPLTRRVVAADLVEAVKQAQQDILTVTVTAARAVGGPT